METMTKIRIVAIAVTAFALGQYTATTGGETKQSSKSTQVEKDQTVDKNIVTTTVTTEETAPDGTRKKRTEVNEHTVEKKSTELNKKTEQESKSEITRSISRLTAGLLLGVDYSDLSKASLMPGLFATRPFLGPITLGAWLIPQASTGGLMAGWQF